MRAIIFATLLTATLGVSNGCAICSPCGPCGPCGQGCFDNPPCGATCGATCGAACSPCDNGGPCGYGGCGPCGGGPIHFIFGVLGFHCGGCDNGCGEVYRGDWCSDPPACQDPCDAYGNYTGCGGCGGDGYVPNNSAPASYAPSGGCSSCGSQAAATRPSQSRAVARAPRKTASARAPQVQNQNQYVGEPKIISETDEAVEEGVTPTSYQARSSRPIDYRR